MKVFSEPKKGRHSLSREPPLPIYLGLKVHSVNRSKKLIDELCSLGISISYERVLQLENNIAFTMCKQFESDGIVCPSILRKGLVTIGAIDNIDHNPSSATAHSSFHGTGISITQFPILWMQWVMVESSYNSLEVLQNRAVLYLYLILRFLLYLLMHPKHQCQKKISF